MDRDELEVAYEALDALEAEIAYGFEFGIGDAQTDSQLKAALGTLDVSMDTLGDAVTKWCDTPSLYAGVSYDEFETWLNESYEGDVETASKDFRVGLEEELSYVERHANELAVAFESASAAVDKVAGELRRLSESSAKETSDVINRMKSLL